MNEWRNAVAHQDFVRTPQAERANYFDVGASQTLFTGFNVGVDSYYKTTHNLIDEGQFGAPIIRNRRVAPVVSFG